MSPAQIKIYRAYVAKWQAAGKVANVVRDDAARYDLHLRCTGRACSSTELTNAELDKVLLAMLQEFDPAAAAEQAALQQSPALRLEEFRSRCHDALAVIVGEDQAHRRNYLGAIVRQVSYGRASSLDKLTERQTQQVMGILEKRVRAMEKQARKVANTGEAVPF